MSKMNPSTDTTVLDCLLFTTLQNQREKVVTFERSSIFSAPDFGQISARLGSYTSNKCSKQFHF